MKLKLKHKISLVLLLIFSLLITIGAMGIIYIDRLADASIEIMKDNYDSVNFTEDMLNYLDDLYAYQLLYYLGNESERKALMKKENEYMELIRQFRLQIKKETNNITEEGEEELADSLDRGFEIYIRNFDRSQQKINTLSNIDSLIKKQLIPDYLFVKNKIDAIYRMNMKAIVFKNDKAQLIASNVSLYMWILSVFSAVLAIVLMFVLPAYFADPIIELNTKIQEIANRNFDQRLELRYQWDDEVSDMANNFNKMVVKLQEYDNSNVARLLTEKKRTDAVIRVFNDAILILDKHKNIVNANTIALELMGLNERKVLGKSAVQLAKTNDLLRLLVNPLMEEEEDIQTFEEETENGLIKIYADDKESFFVKDIIEISNEEEHEEEYNLMGYVISLKNVTELKEIDKAKTNFIATVSHELKTPIASIKMSIELMNNEKIGLLNQEQKDLLNHILEDADRMLKIVKELLNIAELETGKIKLNAERVNPWKLIEYAFQTVQVQAIQKNIHIETNEDALQHFSVIADFEKTAWVFANLLSNAIRYSPENEKIQVFLHQNQAGILFSIHNAGSPIPDEYKNKIFERFFQVPDLKENKMGTGLGLAICKELIEAQNGRIWVENEHVGSTFYFTLPS